MREKRFRVVWTVILLLSVMLTLPVAADFGPKDRLTVYLENPPSELYYLDLLYEEPEGREVYPNLTDEERSALRPEMLEALSSDSFGLTAVLAEGTRIPTFGDLIGEADGTRAKHVFSYYGLPETYRIIIVTESGWVHVSDEFTRAVMQSSITYDCTSGRAEIPPVWRQYALQIGWTLGMTLLIEGVLFLLFGFSLRSRDAFVFLAVNLATQCVLTAVVGSALVRGGTVSAIFAMPVCEICILAVESAAYAFLLRGKTRGRRIAYGVVANLVSWAAGALSMDLLYSFIVSIA